MSKLPWKPWHEAVKLRDDLRSGDLPLHMFAADLYEVMMQRGRRPIYEKPEQFFALTFPTYNLRQLVRDVVLRLARGEEIGTLFLPAASRVESRKRWMVSGLAWRGKVIIDKGAAAALKKEKGSLLPAGIKEVEKEFHRGDIIEVLDLQGNRIACGICNYGSSDITIIKGAHSEEIMSLLGYEYGAEVIHRNNLVMLSPVVKKPVSGA